jgi:cytosine/adenosine deaminase-related metal-dependent hydrolase
VIPVINAHTHLELTTLSFLYSDGPGTLRPWMNRVYHHMNELTNEQVLGAVKQGIDELQSSGTTHVVDISARWLSLQPLLASGLQGIVCLEVRGLERQGALEKLEEAKTFIYRARSKNRSSAMRVGLSLHSPYSCHPILLKEGAAWCAAENIPLSIHVGESPRERKWIQQARMASRFFPGKEPVSYLDSLGVLSARPLLVHCTNLSERDISRVAESGSAVVHCPRSNEHLSNGRMPLERFLSAGIPVYIGTDSVASCPDLNVYKEIEFAKRFHSGLVEKQELEDLVHRSLPSFL